MPSNVEGWQVKFESESGLYYMTFSQVANQVVSVPTVYNTYLFKHVFRSNIAGFDNEELAGSGPFNVSLLCDLTEFDFYFIYKSQLEDILLNNPTHLYFSKAILTFGSSILDNYSGNNMQMLKIECAEGESPFQVTFNTSMSPAPLFFLAPPCPPMWNQLFNVIHPPLSIGIIRKNPDS